MFDEEENANGADPPPSDLQLSEGKSLSFLATNLAGPIELGGLPPVNGGSAAPDADASAPADTE